MEAVVAEALGGEPLHDRRLARSAEGARGAEAEVVLPAAPKTVKMNGKAVAAKNLVLRSGAATISYAPVSQAE